MNILNDVILSEQILSKKVTSENVFHVAFGVDKHYIRGMGITILSLIKNNPKIDFVFHVFYSSISDDDLLKLNQLVNENSITIKLYHIRPEIFGNLPTFAQYTNAIYNRLLVVNQLKNIADTILYLDSDIICLADITEILNIDMNKKIVAVVNDVNSTATKQIKKLNLTNGYFNSGVIYIDVNKWHENNISEKAFNLIIENYKNYDFPDQDALNVVLKDHKVFIERKWNYMMDLEKEKETIPTETVFLHCVGRTKPWLGWCIHPLKDHFVKYYKESPWRDVEFDKPTHYKHMRILYKSSKRYSHYWDAICWYIKYVQTKLKL